MVDVAAASENLALRRLVAVYRHLSGLAVQNADISSVVAVIAEHTQATVAAVGPAMDIIAAAAPGESSALAADYVRELVVHPRLADVLTAAARARRALRLPDISSASVIVAPILVGDDVPAYLLTLDADQRDGEDTSLLLTEHAATICGVILGRERVVAAAAGRVRDDLVEGLLSGRAGDEGEVARWARHLGYDVGRDHHVLSIAVEAGAGRGLAAGGDAAPARPVRGTAQGGNGSAPRGRHGPTPESALRQRATAGAERFLATRAPDAIISVRDAEIVVVLPEHARGGGPADGPASDPARDDHVRRAARGDPVRGDPVRGDPVRGGPADSPVGDPVRWDPVRGGSRAAALARACSARLAELFPDVAVTIGIGGRCRAAADVARSYAQARRTVDTLRRMGRVGGVVAFDDLGIHRLLLQVPSLAELRGFAREVLGALLADEREQAGAYLATLACYFRENNSPQRAAKALHVHPNTVTYRIRRAEEITGLDFGGYRDRLMAQVALEILDAVGDGR